MKNTLSRPVTFHSQILLTVVAITSMTLFYNIGIYKSWYEERSKRNFELFLEQWMSDITEEQKKEEAWGPGYLISKYVVAYFEAHRIKGPVLLIEPNEYLQQTIGIKLPEPVVFYYFTSGKVKAVWMSSPMASEANYILRMSKTEFKIEPINNRQELTHLLQEYKPYKQQL